MRTTNPDPRAEDCSAGSFVFLKLFSAKYLFGFGDQPARPEDSGNREHSRRRGSRGGGVVY
jgi:hypothetical protein